MLRGQVIDFEDEMEALDAMSETGTWKVDSITLQSNVDKGVSENRVYSQ